MSPHEREMLSRDEIRQVIALYDLPRPVTAESIGRGSRQSAKSRLRTPGGDFLLKRRNARKCAPELVAFLHRFQAHLDQEAVPVARLVAARDGATSVVNEAGTYELSQWIEGTRWSRSIADAAEVGVIVGSALRASTSFDPGAHPPTTSFHANAMAAPALGMAAERALAVDPSTDRAILAAATGALQARLMRAAMRAAEAGLSSAPRTCIHGDMHPGNVLFVGGRVRAILDFDGARLDWRACEVANAAMHFANEPIASLPPEQWRPELDLALAGAVVAGIERGMREALLSQERAALPWLMIEACTLESAVPIARTGRFAHLRAEEFLPFIERKTEWIERHAAEISALVAR